MTESRDDMLVWLREQILSRKAAAEAASPGPWVNTGQSGLGDAWQIHGAPTDEVTFKFDYELDDSIREPEPWETPSPLVEVPVLSRVATLAYEDGGGVWRREDADHIVLNQPADTIARCEAELAILDLYERERAEWPGDASWDHDSAQGVARVGALEDVIGRLASGYRHRPGWREE